jgi:tetratricopeptide (TPR) repeat protein
MATTDLPQTLRCMAALISLFVVPGGKATSQTLLASEGTPPADRAAEQKQASPSARVATAAVPWVQVPLDDSSMLAVGERAGSLVRSGFRLGQRAAYYSARSEFIQALRVISQSLDARRKSNLHSQALAAGLRALKEAEDFVPRGSAVEADLNVASLVAAHRTPILKEIPGIEQTSAAAAQRYYHTYCQEQLAMAAGHDANGSMALYGLARVHTALAVRESSQFPAAEPTAICLHQAALMCHAGNYAAANELGVLLARQGRYEDAQQVLRHSVEVLPSHEGLHNLAVVYERLGQSDLAAALQWQSERVARHNAAAKGVAASGSVRVEWVEPHEFAQMSGQPPVGTAPMGTMRREKTIARTIEGVGEGQRGVFNWRPWSSPR